MEEYERDYAERTSEEIVNLMQRFCTPRGEALDVQWFESVLAKVAGIVVDGALLKHRSVHEGGQVPEHRHHHARSSACHPLLMPRPSA